MAEEESGGEMSRVPVVISPETLASIDKITAITLSCTKQLLVINDAIERVLEKQDKMEELAKTLEEHAEASKLNR